MVILRSLIDRQIVKAFYLRQCPDRFQIMSPHTVQICEETGCHTLQHMPDGSWLCDCSFSLSYAGVACCHVRALENLIDAGAVCVNLGEGLPELLGV